MTAQHRKTRTKIHALSGIRIHDRNVQTAETHAPDREVEMCFNKIHSTVCLCANRGTESLRMKLVKLGSCDFPRPRDGTQNNCIAFKQLFHILPFVH